MGVDNGIAGPDGWSYRRLHGSGVHAGLFPGADPYRDGDYPYDVRWVRVGGTWVEDCADLDVVCGPRPQREWRWEQSGVWTVFDRVGIYGVDDCKWI